MDAATDENVPRSVYLVFIIIQLCSSVFALLLISPENVIRSNGTHLAKFHHQPLMREIRDLGTTWADWRVIALMPLMFLPEVSLVISGSLNAYAFNLRTRSLNSVLITSCQIPLVVGMGWLLDSESLGRRQTRALIAVALITVWITGVEMAQTIWLNSWKFDRSITGPEIDLYDSAYPGVVIIYLIYGGQYSIFQNVVLWILGSLSNNPHRSALYRGIFVGDMYIKVNRHYLRSSRLICLPL
jgi:hypothetical protein